MPQHLLRNGVRNSLKYQHGRFCHEELKISNGSLLYASHIAAVII